MRVRIARTLASSIFLLPLTATAAGNFCDSRNDHLFQCHFESESVTEYSPGEFCDFPVQELDETFDNAIVHTPEGEAPGGGHHLASLAGTLTNVESGKTLRFHSAAGFSVRDLSFDMSDDCNGTISYTFIMLGQNLGLAIPGQGLVSAFVGRREFARSITLQDCEVVDLSNELISEAGQWEPNPEDTAAICSYLGQ